MAKRCVIIGAGLTGLSCAHHLRSHCIVLEKLAVVGGTARTVARGSYLFDCTGHWLHMHDADMRGFISRLMGDRLQTIKRRAAVFAWGDFRPYPFQAHTYGLPPDVIAECLLGYFAVRNKRFAAAETLQDFIMQRLGAGFARHFMVPYNTKLWTVAPTELSARWCDKFVPVPSAAQVVQGALSPEGAATALGYNATFLYPATGGIGAIAETLAQSLPKSRVRLALNQTPRQLDWRNKRLTLQDGQVLSYDALLSTMPLPGLLALCGDLPTMVRDAASQLRAVSVSYWDVGLLRSALPGAKLAPHDYHWVYYPEPDLPFYRTGSATAVNPGMAPSGCVSLSVEVAHRQGTACPASDADILQGLVKVGLMRPGEVPQVWQQSRIDTAYVIMDSQYGPARRTIIDWLTHCGIKVAGRYGAWVYDSMESALVAGRQAAYELD